MSLNHIIIILILLFNILGTFLKFELLIYNEEAVIVVCFVLFLSFAYKTIGVGITLDLDDRSAKIQDELSKATLSLKQFHMGMVDIWALIVGISENISLIFSWFSSQVKTISFLSQNGVYRSLVSGTSDYLRVLILDENSFRTSLERDLSQSFFSIISGSRGFHCLGFIDLSHEFLVDINKNSSGLLVSGLVNVKRAGFSQVPTSSFNLALSILTSEQLVYKLMGTRI